MAVYDSLKLRLVATTAALSAPGALATVALGRGDLALPFLIGAAMGIAYLGLLQRGVDGLRGGEDSKGTGAALRLSLIAVLAVAAARLASEHSGGDATLLRDELLSGAAGFLLYKVSVLLVGGFDAGGGGDGGDGDSAAKP